MYEHQLKSSIDVCFLLFLLRLNATTIVDQGVPTDRGLLYRGIYQGVPIRRILQP